MHDHELVAQLAQDADGGAPAADHGTTAPLGRDRPAEQQLAALDVAAGLGDALGDRAVVGHEPSTLDPCLLRTRPHGAGVGARAEQQPQGGHDHRLARAGLTRDGREAGTERQGGLGDHSEVADAELLNQRSPQSTQPSINFNHGPPALAIR